MRPLSPGFVSIAPMIDKTDRHFRYFLRLLTREALLYTEMVTTGAILHGRRDHLLDFRPLEHPLILQLGGDDPDELYQAVRIAEDWGYDEYNLNVGCPSDKVQKGSFGACLMATPDRVRELLAAMASATSRPVGVKHRVGIQSAKITRISYDELAGFIRTVSTAPVDRFVVHARIAILEGLSPKENRTVPPLRYEDVWRLRTDFPELHLEINGNIKTLEDMLLHRDHGMDGVMVGRLSYENPWELTRLDGTFATGGLGTRPAGTAPALFSAGEAPGNQPGHLDLARRFAVARQYAAYIDSQTGLGSHPRSLIWPVLELFAGIRGARRYKQVLSVPFDRTVQVTEKMEQALALIDAFRPD